MRDCPHCSESFDNADEDATARAYLEHLRDVHPAEFGAVDRRRLEQVTGDDESGISQTAVLLSVLAVAVVGIVAFVSFGLGGSGSAESVAADRTPSNLGGVHTHGTMEVVILGDELDFSRDEYQLRANAFHYEGGDGEVWHVHAEGVTLEWALSSLGIEVTQESVTFDGTTYTDGDEYDVSVTVNGEPVEPSTYVLQGASDVGAAGPVGDTVRVVVARA